MLARLSLDRDEFRRAEEHWTAELAEAHARRKGGLAMRFAAAFGEAVRAVGLVTAEPAPAREAPAAPDVPTFLLAAPGAAPAQGGPPPPLAPAPPPPATPAAVARPVDVGAIVANMMRSHGGVRGGETAALPTAATGAPLPFAPGAPGARIEFTREAPPLARQDTGTLPPAQPSATPTYQPAAHELTLEQYAQVSAELALSSDLASVLRRYRLAEPYWREQARLWDDRVKRDTRLQVRCMEVLRALQRAPR